jgi:hypothetical protein
MFGTAFLDSGRASFIIELFKQGWRCLSNRAS